MQTKEDIKKYLVINIKKKLEINIRILEKIIKMHDDILSKNQDSKETKILKKIETMKKSYESFLIKYTDIKDNFNGDISYEKLEPIVFRNEEKFCNVLSDSYEIYNNIKENCKDEKINKDVNKICVELSKFLGLNEAWMDALVEALEDMEVAKSNKVASILKKFNVSFEKFKSLSNESAQKFKSSSFAMNTLMKIAIGIVGFAGGYAVSKSINKDK